MKLFLSLFLFEICTFSCLKMTKTAVFLLVLPVRSVSFVFFWFYLLTWRVRTGYARTEIERKSPSIERYDRTQQSRIERTKNALSYAGRTLNSPREIRDKNAHTAAKCTESEARSNHKALNLARSGEDDSLATDWRTGFAGDRRRWTCI